MGAAFEEDALGVGGLPDGFEFVEAQQAGQGEGVALIVLVMIVADEAVAAGITDDELLDVGQEELAEPAANFTAMWPSPPIPTTPAFLPLVTPQWRIGEYVVMPAQSRGAAPARSRLEGTRST